MRRLVAMTGQTPQRLVLCACLFCFSPCLLVAVLKPRLENYYYHYPASTSSSSTPSENLQISLTTSIEIHVLQQKKSKNEANQPDTTEMASTSTTLEKETNKRTNPTFTEELPSGEEEREQETAPQSDQPAADINLETESTISCDLSERRSDTCVMHGDVRVLGFSSSIILAKAARSDAPAESEHKRTWKIRPYARKWETDVMLKIREFTITESISHPSDSPACAVRHSVPGVVFSTGGFLGNFFHDFDDVLIPLFATSHEYGGQVQFLVTSINRGWISKYEQVLRRLSHYPIIDLDRDGRVHCFRDLKVGLLSHKVLGMDPSNAPHGYSMADFRELLRSSFSLRRKRVRISSRSHPRLLVIDRKGSRSLTNRREVAAAARELGFKVIVAGPQETRNVSRFAQIVNSCDAMMGVHGAGLTNMVFLPSDATLVQIIPWGGLTYACRHDFGEPAPDMGIRYLEYEIREEESSLIQQYPRNHTVFTDPQSIHKQGWGVLWSVFLNKQSVRVDLAKFRGVLEEVLRGLASLESQQEL